MIIILYEYTYNINYNTIYILLLICNILNRYIYTIIWWKMNNLQQMNNYDIVPNSQTLFLSQNDNYCSFYFFFVKFNQTEQADDLFKHTQI